MGPRIPGSAGHERTRHYLLSTLDRLADRIEIQDFFYVDPFGRFTLPGTNIVASFRPETSPRVMLAAHWDSRPRADRELLPERRALAVPGANDGASGVAVLLEMARSAAGETAGRRGGYRLFRSRRHGERPTGLRG